MKDTPSAERIVGLLAGSDRLRVAAALILGAKTIADVAASAGLSVPAVNKAIARLIEGELVERDGPGYRLNEAVLQSAAQGEARARRPSAPTDPADRLEQKVAGSPGAAVLRAFVKDGRLVSIPASHSKRLPVLDLIAQDFEVGRRYPERRVSEILLKWHPDHAALRRYLVDDGILAREGGGGDYWRSGGTVDVGSSD